jgi:adenylate cyclase
VNFFRFRRFSTRVLALVLGLLFASLATTYILVSLANTATALRQAESNLELGARVFDEAVRQRIDYLAGSASVMTRDYAIKQVLLQEPRDTGTLASALPSYAIRVGAPVVVVFDPDRTLRASSEGTVTAANQEPFRDLIERAILADVSRLSGFSYLNDQLHVLVVVPLYAPEPEVAAWFGLAFPIDRAFAQKIKDTTNLEVTFVSTKDPARPRVLATTLPAPAAALVAPAAGLGPRTAILDLPADRYVSLFKPQKLLGEKPVALVLQRPLGPELAPSAELESNLLLVSLAALALATLAAIGLARSVSRPVLALVGHTQRIARGDYTVRNTAYRADELGRLSEAFDAMARGLDERDRVRDLLDKNVSPEIAAQLLRDGAALGGEERQVTVLFADLRGFTTLSEQLPAPELLALLNRYLDRMSAALEAHGGVIDKYIGDAIMALFGAPVAHGDDADRALAAALAMQRALAQFNLELAAEGKPPLGIGIGINTARVVAGNIGSSRRLNYSVIGDGVNVAARIESLTRNPEYRTSIITTAATLAARSQEDPATPAPNYDSRAPFAVSTFPIRTRPLGTVAVKGRAEPVEIFAVE